jgi:glucosyl-dolichyl phosphate glucuronosyltransferase
MRVSIIIPTYNRDKYIGITIQSFLELNYSKDLYEIIIVDNNSNDNTKSVVQKFIENNNGVKISYLFEARQGVHYARNSAARVANSELLYFTDDDMIADPELLNELVQLFLFDDKVGVATGKVLPKWEDTPPTWILRHCNNYLLSLLDPNYEFVIAAELPYLYSCHQAVRRDVFFLAEGFNPEYTRNKYMGDGETGLNIKIIQLGYKFGFNGKSLIYHMIPGSRFTQRYLNKRLANNGIAHSYSAFRRCPTNSFLLKQILKKIAFKMPAELAKYLIMPIVKRDASLYRFFIAKWHYYFSSVSFDLQILFTPRLKKFVLKRDWLTNDQDL